MTGPNRIYQIMGATQEITILRNSGSVDPKFDGWFLDDAGGHPRPVDPYVVYMILIGARKLGKLVIRL